jgi:hypothetical protein
MISALELINIQPKGKVFDHLTEEGKKEIAILMQDYADTLVIWNKLVKEGTITDKTISGYKGTDLNYLVKDK